MTEYEALSPASAGLDPEHLFWYLLTPEERWREGARLWDIYRSLSEAERRAVMRGHIELAPGEFRRRLAQLRRRGPK